MLIISMRTSISQNTNWSTLTDQQQNLVYFNFGYDYGITTQIGYAKRINSTRPIFLTFDFSVPKGKNLVDDHKVRIGAQAPVYQFNDFILTAKIYSNYRRHQTKYVRMFSFGTEMSALFGYYKPKWQLALEFGFDKSIITHLKHTDAIRDNYPAIKDGWFIPSGGHFFYGLQGCRKLGNKTEFNYRLGLTKAQFDDEDDLLPYYAQIGFNYWIYASGK